MENKIDVIIDCGLIHDPNKTAKNGNMLVPRRLANIDRHCDEKNLGSLIVMKRAMYRFAKNPRNSDSVEGDPGILDTLKNAGRLELVDVESDDIHWIELAERHKAYIITADKFMDKYNWVEDSNGKKYPEKDAQGIEIVLTKGERTLYPHLDWAGIDSRTLRPEGHWNGIDSQKKMTYAWIGDEFSAPDLLRNNSSRVLPNVATDQTKNSDINSNTLPQSREVNPVAAQTVPSPGPIAAKTQPNISGKKLNAWQQFVKDNSNDPLFTFKAGPLKGKLNLKAMARDYNLDREYRQRFPEQTRLGRNPIAMRRHTARNRTGVRYNPTRNNKYAIIQGTVELG